MRRLLPFVLAVALAGCIQVQLPAAPAAPDAAQAAAPPSTYAVSCLLRDENGTPLRQGTCEYHFGNLGATVPVDGNGSAVRRVPAGATGTLAGAAPGRAGAQASLTVTNDKNVRMTLPRLPKAPAAPPRADANATAPAGNGTAEEPGRVVNTTAHTGSVRTQLFDESYYILPVDTGSALQTDTFTVPPGFQMLEVLGGYSLGAVAGMVNITITGPSGQVVASDELPGRVDGVPVNAGLAPFDAPLAFVPDPEPGTYRVEVTGAAVPQYRVQVFGLSGLAPDFEFNTFPDGVQRHLHDYAGKVVIVDLMAEWCGPCNAAMPGLKSIYADYEGLVEILSVDVTYDDSGSPDTPESDTPQDLQAFIDRHNVTWPIGPDGTANQVYGTGFIPTMVLVDQHGGLMYRHIGEIDQAELRARIDAALAR